MFPTFVRKNYYGDESFELKMQKIQNYLDGICQLVYGALTNV